MEILTHLKDLVVFASEAAEHAAPAAHVALGPQEPVKANFLWLIPAFPLLGAAINAFGGKALQRRFGKHVTSNIAIAMMVCSFAVALVALAKMISLPAEQRYVVDRLWTMITAGDVQVD